MTTPTTTPDTPSLQERLEAPMRYEYRPQGKPFFDHNQKITVALGIPYITAAEARRRLDQVFGPMGWKPRSIIDHEYTYTPAGQNARPVFVCVVSCEILVLRDGSGWPPSEPWVEKGDTGFGRADTIEDARKAAFSDAMKRAAAVWGVGRFLEDIQREYMPCAVNDKGGFIRWLTPAPPPPAAPPAKPQTPAEWAAASLAAFTPLTQGDLESYFGPVADWTRESHGPRFRRLHQLIWDAHNPIPFQQAAEQVEAEFSEPHYEPAGD